MSLAREMRNLAQGKWLDDRTNRFEYYMGIIKEAIKTASLNGLCILEVYNVVPQGSDRATEPDVPGVLKTSLPMVNRIHANETIIQTAVIEALEFEGFKVTVNSFNMTIEWWQV